MNIRLVLLPLFALLFMVQTSCSDSHSAATKAEVTYAAIARGKIDVEGGLLNIAAPTDAIFREVNVQVGSKIKAGDIMATLNSEQELLAVDMTNAEIHHTQTELTALTNRLKTSEQLAQHWHAAATAGAAEQQQDNEAQQALMQLNADIDIAKATLEMATIKRKQALYALSQRSLRAPQDAEVMKIFAQAGTTLGANQSIAFILLPAKPLIVRADVNENFIAQIHQGSTAVVSLESTPQAPPLKAHVIRVGSMLENGHWGDDQQPSRTVECILAFESTQTLLVGQNLMVKFNEQH